MMQVLNRAFLLLSILSLSLPAWKPADGKIDAADVDSPNSVDVDRSGGYSVDDTEPTGWIDATGGTPVFAGGGDNAVSDAIGLGFDFPFFEGSYSNVYIGTNGLLGFQQSSLQANTQASANLEMPMDYAFPQNFIAPFWDNLVVNDALGGNVYYMSDLVSSPSYFVVAWHNVVRSGYPYTMTFEAILYDTGDVVFQYQSLPDGYPEQLTSATVGIEDGDGIYGVQYIYNEPGLATGSALRFIRPDKDERVKVFPVYQSQFNIGLVSNFQVTIRNTGDYDGGATDTFNLTATSSSPSWNVSLQNAGGTTVTNTGPLAKGASFTLYVKVTAPANADVGNYTSVTVKATSTRDTGTPKKNASAELVSVIPANFAQVYRDGLKVAVEMVSRGTLINKNVFYSYNGGGFALSPTAGKDLFLTWQSAGLLEYNWLSNTGQKRLTNDPQVSATPEDWSAVAAVAPNGDIGVAWIERQNGCDLSKNRYNIYFAIVNPVNGLVRSETDVTQTPCIASGDPGSYQFISGDLTITAVDATTDKFEIAWTQMDLYTLHTDIYLAVFNASGDYSAAPTVQAIAETHSGLSYGDPALVTYNGDHALLFYFERDPNNVDRLVYVEIDGNGVPGTQKTAFNVDGADLDAVQLSGGRVAISWISNEKVSLAIVSNDSSLTPVTNPPVTISNPDKRKAISVSVASDPNGRAILTWNDNLAPSSYFSERLYYALYDSNGNQLSPASIFRYSSQPGTSRLQTVTAFGNTSFTPFGIYLPLIRR